MAGIVVTIDKRKSEGGRSLRSGGRPSQLEASRIGERILDIATDLFLTHGYGSTSIEAVAKRAGISKRTFYHRFNDKADLFRAVARRLLTRMRPQDVAPLFKGGTLEEILQRLSKIILNASLSPEALALHRLIISEATRFPELVTVMETESSRQEAIKRISDLLKHQARFDNAQFAAEQFLVMLVSVPQRRTLGLGGMPMTSKELDAWVENTVHLFLHGCLV